MAEIFYDNGTLFFAMPRVGTPYHPYWKTFMEIGQRCDDMNTDDNGNWSFFDEDGLLLGIQMVDPVDESGAPKESSLYWLRQIMKEDELVMFLDTVKSCYADVGLTEDDETLQEKEQADYGEFTFRVGPEGPDKIDGE